MDLHKKILAYHGKFVENPHHRYRSWEHCYGFFRQTTPTRIVQERHHAALQLGFYLASWGMYRNSFLLQHAYSVHLGVIDCLALPEFASLWDNDIGSKSEHSELARTILAAVEAVRAAYSPFKPTDTLVTKVLLGTFGCLPACDRYFIDGFKKAGFKYAYLNAQFVGRILKFCDANMAELGKEQARIEGIGGVRYPFMKLADMYFWQVGFEASMQSGVTEIAE